MAHEKLLQNTETYNRPVLTGSHFGPPSCSPCCVYTVCLVFAGSHFQPLSCSLCHVYIVLCSQDPISNPSPVHFEVIPLSCVHSPISNLLCSHWPSCVHGPISNPCPVAVFTLTVLCPQSHFQPLSCCCVYTDCPVSTVPFPTCCVYTDWPAFTVPFPTCCVYTDWPAFTVPFPSCCVYTDCPVFMVPFPTCCVYTDCPVSTVPFPTCCVYTDCPVFMVPFPTCCVYTDCPVSTVPFPTCCVYTDWPAFTVPFPTCCVYTDWPAFTVPVRHYSSLPLPLPLLATSLCYLLLSPIFNKRFYLKHYAASFLTLVTHSVLLHYFPIIMWFIFPSKSWRPFLPQPYTLLGYPFFRGSCVCCVRDNNRFLCLLSQG